MLMRADGEDDMALAPGRFDYAPITDRPIIKWPGNARVAFLCPPDKDVTGSAIYRCHWVGRAAA